MIIIESKKYFLKKKNIWFSETPFDVEDCNAVFFFSCKKNVDKTGFEKIESPTLIIDLRKELDDIWRSIGKKSCRYFINRAIRESIKIEINTHYAAFMRLYSKFVKEKNFRSTQIDIASLKKHSTLFTASLNSETIAGIILLEDSQNIKWLLGGSKRLEANKEKSVLISCANRLLIWEAIKYAKAKGLMEFDFGGYYTGDDTNDPRNRINHFKKQFGGSLITYYNYSKYYSKFYSSTKKFIKLIR